MISCKDTCIEVNVHLLGHEVATVIVYLILFMRQWRTKSMKSFFTEVLTLKRRVVNFYQLVHKNVMLQRDLYPIMLFLIDCALIKKNLKLKEDRRQI